MTEFHGILVVVNGIVDTSHHTLVITEEEDGQSCNAIDCDQKTTLLKLVSDVHAGDAIRHGEVCPMGLECI